MLMKEAMALIKKSEKVKPEKPKKIGFMVHFEKVEGHLLAGGYFPDGHTEKLIKTEEEAWVLAHRFAKATDPKEYINIYVVNSNWTPVAYYN